MAFEFASVSAPFRMQPSMNHAVLAYRGFADARARLLVWLKARAGA